MMNAIVRQLVVDTETTGLEFAQGHRVIEIGCVELINRRPSGETFHHYVNPEREIDEAAMEVHGITAASLRDKPTFADLAEELLTFIKGAELIIHNAPFDVGFLNNEFALAGHGDGTIETHCTVVDTLAMARHKHPGQRNSLDALCGRYSVDNSQRELHGALLDAEILADVYLAMTGGQVTLLGESAELPAYSSADADDGNLIAADGITTPLIRASGEALAEHEKWLQLLETESGGAVFRSVEDAK